jgi:hypothetical protein
MCKQKACAAQLDSYFLVIQAQIVTTWLNEILIVIGLKHPYLNTGQTLAANLSIPLNSATPYRGSGLVLWPNSELIST